ncbi:MAG: DUF4417 domain-containing protein [Clostridia bacterium]|nr:DUF4417 domain-containing protein [Clostridia bacterium]
MIVKARKIRAKGRKIPYRATRFWENLNKRVYRGYGQYNLPPMLPCTQEAVDAWIPYTRIDEVTPQMMSRIGVHFWVRQECLEACWEAPDSIGERIKMFGAVASPAFFMPGGDAPGAICLYNAYRSSWLARYWREMGINIIPSLYWDQVSLARYAFIGCPEGSIYTVSYSAMRKNGVSEAIFMDGMEIILEVLRPKELLFYGEIPEKYRDISTIMRSSFRVKRVRATLPK